MINIFRNCSCILLLVVIKQNNNNKKNRRQEFFHSGKVSTELNHRSGPFSVKKFLLDVPVYMTHIAKGSILNLSFQNRLGSHGCCRLFRFPRTKTRIVLPSSHKKKQFMQVHVLTLATLLKKFLSLSLGGQCRQQHS